MYVFQDKNGTTRVQGAFLRIGRQSCLVDNSASGGLVSRIDPETGQLHQACGWSPALAFSPVHPDHGARIGAVILPFWQQARALGMRTLRVLPGTRFAGLDIAIIESGPVMVEVNIQPSSNGLSFMKIPTARIFNS
ncbi:MAG: hypothetical protein GXP02_04060, partial [Alphaproteobacteria bacterium]|nr:hypothetical protein [Alphaproteobacteria bacterium]